MSDSEENRSLMDEEYDAKIVRVCEKWEKLSSEEVIEDAILRGDIPIAQAFLTISRKDTSSSLYSEFEKAAEKLILHYLRQDMIEETLSVLFNMGIDIDSKLLEVFKSTSEKDVRTAMLKEITERNLLTESDQQSLNFLSILEKLYPCTSFEHARILLDEKCQMTGDMVCALPENKENLTVGDFMNFNQDNSESGSYCRIVLNWLSSWDEDLKGQILAPYYLKNSPILEYCLKEGGECEISKQSVWLYLLEHGNLQYLISWIDIWLGLRPQNSNSFAMLDKWDISDEMINLIPEKATAYVSEELLNALARHGIFCEEELKSIPSLLCRLGKAQCNINDMATFMSDKSSISFSDLCHRLVHYCLKHNLIQFLYSFLSRNYNKFTVWPSCPLCSVPVLNLAKAFYMWSENKEDSRKAFDAVATAAQYIFQLKNTSRNEIISKVPPPLSLAILLFKRQSLSQAIGGLMMGSDIEIQNVKKAFQSYPMLFNFLFKSPEERLQPDITVYELLKGSTVFDTSQLFGWQAANTLKAEDSQKELPHFSLSSLAEQYGLKKELTYLYYLMEGRPNYSYLKFIAQEVVLETGLSMSRVRLACREVTDYALSNYKSPEICAACVCFVELLGQDSLPLRACLVAANMLHDNQFSEAEQEQNKSSPEIGRKFKQAYSNKDVAALLISELENIIMNTWDPYCTNSNALLKDITLWMPIMLLSHLYEVEAGNLYLYERARQNDWLKFLVFSQIFQIPKEQVLKAASRFSNSCISYHVFHSLHRKSSLLYDVAYETKVVPTVKPEKKDMRKSWYSRLGVIQKSPSTDKRSPPNQDDDAISISSEDTSSSSDIDLKSFVLKDLFSQLLLANSSDFPWDCLLHTSYEIKNPILALLSASYPEASIENCLFMWLYTVLHQSEQIQKQLESSFPEVRVTNCSAEELEKIILLAVRNHRILTLWQGMHMFLPDTPLPALLGYLRSFMVYKKFDSSIETFQNQLWDYTKNSESESFLHSLHWIESIASSILKEAVIVCSTSYERLIMLQHFHYTKLEKSFSTDVTVPPYMKVYKMVQCLNELKYDADINNLFLPENDQAYLKTCWDAIEKLLEHHLYEEAQLFSVAAHLPQEEMLILQIHHETSEAQKSYNWTSLLYRINFWENILLKLKVLSLHSALDFLEVQCEISDRFGEKYFLMKSILDILKMKKRTDPSAAITYNMESLNRKMWWWCIKAEVNQELLPEIFAVRKVHDIDVLEIFSDYNIPVNFYSFDDESEKRALDSIIGQFLKMKDVQKAFEVASTFGYACNDLKVIKTCLELAKGIIEVCAVDLSLPNCAHETSSSRIISSLLIWVNSVRNVNDISASDKAVIQCFDTLSKKTAIATAICHQILVDFTVAMVLKMSYDSIAEEKDAFKILKRILISKLNDEHVLAKSFIVVREIPDTEIALFLSTEIWHSLTILCNTDILMMPEDRSAFSEESIYDPLRTNEGFQLIVKLCQDPSILGNALMSIFSSEASELTPQSSDQNFKSLVDLCICAHECFTTACNMDGISLILHSSQMLVNLLEEAEKFQIMIHLLTGLGRYSEMMYVFDILKSNDKLNMLFEKPMEEVPNLKLALLDYLKRCPPSEENNYFYKLASRFGMYREKAEILEMSVQKLLSQLCKRNTALDNEMKDELEKALVLLSEAAKSYCEAECLHQAQSCTRLAQLIALQIYFLPSGVWIIGLDESSVARFITDHDKFSQAYIVAEEYGNHHLWSQALLHNVILRGDREYLHDFQSHIGLSASLISDVVKRYKTSMNKNENTCRNMKLLLSHCNNVKVKYSLAKDLGFSDIISDLLMGEASSYLQDLMANNALK